MAGRVYDTQRWKRLRKLHLSLHPFCEDCLARGKRVLANTVDHKVAISGGGPMYPGHDGLTSYCASCHSRKTARGIEAGAVKSKARGWDADGNPLDDRHPWNGGDGRRTSTAIERGLPSDLKPSRIPLTIVCGAPGSGKSTYVRANAGPRDRVICFDTIMRRLTGRPEHHHDGRYVARALELRNAMLRELANDYQHEAAWFIVVAARPADRRKWRARLRGKVVLMDTPLVECIRRIKLDPARPDDRREKMIAGAWEWWDANPHLVA